MKQIKFVLFAIIAISFLSFVASIQTSNGERTSSPIKIDGCVVIGGTSAPAIIRVFEEKADNTKGDQLIPEQWIQRDQKIPIKSERGRIIYDYKYRADDSWKTDVHAWCHNGEDRKIP